MKLKIGLMNNKELAEWFGIKESTFKSNKKKKLEELKKYCQFEETKGKVYIFEIYQEEYQKHYSELVERYDKAKEKHDELSYKIEQKKAQSEKMKLFIKALKNRDEVITEFDDALWGSLVDFITIGKKERTVTFKDGTVVEI